MSLPAALALGCLLQGPWNRLPVIDCNEGPRLYGAEVSLKDGRHWRGYVALAKALPAKAGLRPLALFKPDCGLSFFQAPDVALGAAEPPDDECLFDEFAARSFERAWLPREGVADIPAKKIKALRLAPADWDGISSERFLVLSAAERKILAEGGPRVPLTDYQGSGRMELVGGKKMDEARLWEQAPALAAAVKQGGKAALIQEKARMLKAGLVLLFYPDVEP
jgi:hypothetical protein